MSLTKSMLYYEFFSFVVVVVVVVVLSGQNVGV